MRAPLHMSTTGKLFLGVGAAGAAVAALYWLFKRRDMLIPSDPSEWALPSFTQTSEYLAPEGQQACNCPAGSTPFRRSDGSCSCEPINIEVLAYGSKCRSDAQCPAGICIDGTCQPEFAWES